MAIKLVSNYAKRLGLPGFSSHQFSVSIETELTDLCQVQGEATRVYELLQNAVDREIQMTGFVPGHDYGDATPSPQNGNHVANGNGSNGNHLANGRWTCSDKQKELVLKLIGENDLDLESVDQIAVDRFGVGMRGLNKLQASGLISELLESCSTTSRNGNGKGGRH
ncbi:MAG: hypothetical protein CMO55_08075 [Verrucomicrobiales bacterium]|nr:hypothetical protein [Verrucomicrobiales bacterium]